MYFIIGVACPALSVDVVNQLTLLDQKKWIRKDTHEGYAIGNGSMYMVGALGNELARKGLACLPDSPISLTQIAEIHGPTYGNNNLGSGWEVIPSINQKIIQWGKERVVCPTSEFPFYGVLSTCNDLTLNLTDILDPTQTILLRQLIITRPQKIPTAHIAIDLPVYSDPRNGHFINPETETIIDDRDSISPEQMCQIDLENTAIILPGAPRKLYLEPTMQYEVKVASRFLVTGMTCSDKETRISVDKKGFHVDLGQKRCQKRCQRKGVSSIIIIYFLKSFPLIINFLI